MISQPKESVKADFQRPKLTILTPDRMSCRMEPIIHQKTDSCSSLDSQPIKPQQRPLTPPSSSSKSHRLERIGSSIQDETIEINLSLDILRRELFIGHTIKSTKLFYFSYIGTETLQEREVRESPTKKIGRIVKPKVEEERPKTRAEKRSDKKMNREKYRTLGQY